MFADKANEDGKDKDKKKQTPPGLAKKDGVPPGLEKKDGDLPPGIAKKQQEPAGPTATVNKPAAAPVANAVTTTPTTKPAEPAPVGARQAAAATPTAAAASEEQKAKLADYARRINDGAQKPSLRLLALRQIATETGMPFDRLQSIEKANPGIKPATLLLGSLIAKRSRTSFEELLVEHNKGKSWADMARWHNVPFDALVQKAGDVAGVVQAANTAAAR